MLVFLQQLRQFIQRTVKPKVFHIVPRSHDTADGALCHAQHPLDHMAFLLVEDFTILVIAVCQQMCRMTVDLGLFVLAAQHAQYGFCGTLTQRPHLGKETAAVKLGKLVQGFDHHRETDRCVEIALRNGIAKAFGHQAETNHQQEAEAQNDNGWVSIHEARKRLAG
ncbi:hypothetical protein D3C75_992690 [compost metagenome]